MLNRWFEIWRLFYPKTTCAQLSPELLNRQIHIYSPILFIFNQEQGCQIFRGSIYQNGKNVPNAHKIYQIAINYTEKPKWPQNMPASSISRPFKIYPNWYFWFENMPSGNPGWSEWTTYKRETVASGNCSSLRLQGFCLFLSSSSRFYLWQKRKLFFIHST
jgi:hypothetical protein